MELYVVLLLSSCGFRVVRQAEEAPPTDECSIPPENKEMVTCCTVPSRHLLGDIRESKRFCAMKLKEKYKQQKEGDEELYSGQSQVEEQEMRRMHWHLRRDGCFPECLLEQEGLLVENKVNEQALLDRIQTSLEDEKEWLTAGQAAIGKCMSTELEIKANETCRSGAAEALNCVFRELFLECPFWLESNEYCKSLREFHLRCPEAPPPHMFGKRRHHYHYHYHNHQQPMPEADTPANTESPQEP